MSTTTQCSASVEDKLIHGKNKLTSSSEEESSDDSINSLLLNFDGDEVAAFCGFDFFVSISFTDLFFDFEEVDADCVSPPFSFSFLLYSAIAMTYFAFASAAFCSHS